MVGIFDRASSSSLRPASTFVPSRRTTSGTLKPIEPSGFLNFVAALMMPCAITSHRMMPPKMLTSTPLTLGSDRMIPKASVTASSVAPPPTSRKFAGSPPCSLMMSIVAIARPAPFTRHPMFPSSAMYVRPNFWARTS